MPRGRFATRPIISLDVEMREIELSSGQRRKKNVVQGLSALDYTRDLFTGSQKSMRSVSIRRATTGKWSQRANKEF